MMAIANDDAAETSLAMLGRFDDVGMDRRLARFRGRLRELRDDPAEAARIDALVAEAEREEQEERDPDVASANGLTIRMDSGVVNVSRENADPAAAVPDVLAERAAAIQRELDLHRDALAATQADGISRARPRRVWGAVFAPAFGGAALVAILAAATVAVALHTTVAAMTAVASVLAVTTAAAALLSLWMPWSSVRQLNQRGEARMALELLSRGPGLEEASQQREHAEMLAVRARHFAVEDREAQWHREDRNWEREWQRLQRETEHREVAQRRRDQLEVLRLLADRGHLDSYSDLIPDLIKRIGGEVSFGSGNVPETRSPLATLAPVERYGEGEDDIAVIHEDDGEE